MAHFWSLSLSLHFPSAAFLGACEATLNNETLVTLLALGTRAACTAAFIGPSGVTDLGILEDGGLPGETGRAVVSNS